MLGRLIGEDVELLTIPEPELWQVEVDPGQMEQMIMNLAINAKDAMSTCADSAAGHRGESSLLKQPTLIWIRTIFASAIFMKKSQAIM